MNTSLPLRKRFKHFIKDIAKSSFTTSLLGGIIYAYARLVGYTTKWQKQNIEESYKIWDKEKKIILVIWHGRTLLPCHFWHNKKKYPMTALVSPHRDGRIIAAVLRCFGMKTVDGSSNENAHGAALALMRELQRNTSITIIPDGPKGPNMKLTPSTLYYAQKTGTPIIGMTYSVKKAKFANRSWDKMMLPSPFSKGIVATTRPFYISDTLTNEEFEQKRLEIETELTELMWNLDKQLGHPKIEQGTIARPKKYQDKGL